MARAILAQLGEGQEPIALLLEDNAPMIVAILGVLKTGKIYVPLDPSFPHARNTSVLEDTQAELIVTNSRNLSLANELGHGTLQLVNTDGTDANLSTENIGLYISPDTLSWILYELQEKLDYVLERVKWRIEGIKRWAKMLVCRFYLHIGRRVPPNLRMFYFFEVNHKAVGRYLPQVYPGGLTLLRGRSDNGRFDWADLAAGKLEFEELPGNHLDAIRGPHVPIWSKKLRDCLEKAQGTILGKRTRASSASLDYTSQISL